MLNHESALEYDGDEDFVFYVENGVNEFFYAESYDWTQYNIYVGNWESEVYPVLSNVHVFEFGEGEYAEFENMLNELREKAKGKEVLVTEDDVD